MTGDVRAPFRRWLEHYPTAPHFDFVDNGTTRLAFIGDDRDDETTRRVISNFRTELGDTWDYEFAHAPAGNAMMLSYAFWRDKLLRYEYVLIYQRDSICLQAIPDEYFGYDFIGAPCGDWVMNGGLSLRKTAAMCRALRLVVPNEGEPEDVYFSRALRQIGGVLPKVSLAASFSVENMYVKLPYGIHGTDKDYLSDNLAEYIMSRAEEFRTRRPELASPE